MPNPRNITAVSQSNGLVNVFTKGVMANMIPIRIMSAVKRLSFFIDLPPWMWQDYITSRQIDGTIRGTGGKGKKISPRRNTKKHEGKQKTKNKKQKVKKKRAERRGKTIR
jgi:hypothetical protein